MNYKPSLIHYNKLSFQIPLTMQISKCILALKSNITLNQSLQLVMAETDVQSILIKCTDKKLNIYTDLKTVMFSFSSNVLFQKQQWTFCIKHYSPTSPSLHCISNNALKTKRKQTSQYLEDIISMQEIKI